MLAIRLFGKPRFALDDVAWKLAAGRRTIPLLAYLLMHRDAPIARDHLGELLWPDNTDEAARTNLRRRLHNLSKALPAAADGAPYKRRSYFSNLGALCEFMLNERERPAAASDPDPDESLS